MCCHQHLILQPSAKFRANRTIGGGVMTSYPFFSRWRPAAIFDLMWVIFDHLRSAIVGLSLVLKFGLGPIYSFRDIAIFIFCRFDLKLDSGPKKGVQRRKIFPSKGALQLKKVCYKVSLCQYYQRQRWKAFIGLAYLSVQKCFAGDVPYYVEISQKMTHPL